MSEYKTISSDYHVLCVDDSGNITKQIFSDDPLYNKAIDKMVESFNEMHLEKYFDDNSAKRHLGYNIKDKIDSIQMKRTGRLDEHGMPYVCITVKGKPSSLRMTQKVKDFLDDYISAQFCDGWGESFFYPYNSFVIDGQRMAIE